MINSTFLPYLSKIAAAGKDNDHDGGLSIITNANGSNQIQQSQRNLLRKQGIEALVADLKALYEEVADVVITKDGIAVAVENEASDCTITILLPFTIKSTDYDPFIEADKYDEAVAASERHRKAVAEAEASKAAKLAAARAAKMAATLK